MIEKLPLTPFEREIVEVISSPKPRAEFVDQLSNQLKTRVNAQKGGTARSLIFRPAFIAFFIGVFFLISAILYIGPEVVYAAVCRLFGYIPGIGIVDESAPIRILKEPVSLTRDSITVSVNQVILTVDETRIEFGISGVPSSAYPGNEAVSGCIPDDYLLLPDGTRLDTHSPFPMDVNQATFVLPCIFDTLPGTVPTDWEIPLEFIPIPADVTIMPVIELHPTTENETITPAPSQETIPESAQSALSVDKVIETENGYILIGSFHPDPISNGWAQITGMPPIKDAKGNKVDYMIPEDIQIAGDEENQFPWIFKINATQIIFPITIQFSGEIYTRIDTDAPVTLEFDSGSNPQPGQEWTINQDVFFGEYQIRLETIHAIDNGYSFSFSTQFNNGKKVTMPSVQIDEYAAVGGGGGGGGDGRGETSLIFNKIPKGKLKIILSEIFAVSDQKIWDVQWQPEIIHTNWPTPTVPAASICVNENNFNEIPSLLSTLKGKILLTELNPDINLVLSNLDGSARQVIGLNNMRGILSLDGSQVAYPGEENIEIVNLTTGETSFIKNMSGYDLHWSPDGSQMAVVNPSGKAGIYITSIDGSDPKQLSNLGYESITGWSPDGSLLYYAIPGSTDDGFLLKSVNTISGKTHEVFILKDSSRKAPSPTISPDGNWIAYRSRDHSKIYLISIDGTQQKSVLSLPSDHFVISSLHWDQNGSWLGTSVINLDTQENLTYLIFPKDCTTYRINEINGELNGLIIDQD